MNILIIGAGGFIGSHLSERILKDHKNWRVTGIDISSKKIEQILGEKNFEFIKADIMKDLDLVEERVKACDVVFPLAAVANPKVYVDDPLRVFELDFEANLRIVRWAVKYKKRLIFPSTSEVYGMCEDEEFDEETSNCVTGPICKQRWIYSCCKQLLDRVIYAYGIRDGLRYTLFRPFNWYGPRLDDIDNPNPGSSRVYTQFMSAIKHGKDIQLVDGGDQIRCFTPISEGIDALMKILENEDKADKRIFNIGNPDNMMSIKELAYKLLEEAKYDPTRREMADRVRVVSVKSSEYYGEGYQDVKRRVPRARAAPQLLL
ncbi:MAG: bifunctional UDP-4-keto-pentose/UDP-xylose synthase [Holosporaceae bacterium]|nr:bifunctional UDP-4-keto-pentose/UDP-xylose synthase [Holosporaceae bacterium]